MIRACKQLSCVLATALATLGSAAAAGLTQADITQVYKQVTVTEPGQSPEPAQINQRVDGKARVATGSGARAELKFADGTVTRLGANTVFSFSEGTRDMNLDDGTMLLRVPKNAGGATITTAAVSAAITGTTVMVEAQPPTTQGAAGDDLGFTKWIVLEGTMRVYVNDRIGESRLINPGQMVILPPTARAIPMPVDVDLARLLATSTLVTKGPAKLESTDLIVESVEKQEEEIKDGGLVPTNLIILGKGNEVVLASDGLLSQIQNGQNALSIEYIESLLNGEVDDLEVKVPEVVKLPEPEQPADKYGQLVTIETPNPFPIDETTVINTDPTITTPSHETGVAEGTMYNTQVQGLASDFFFEGDNPSVIDPTLDVLAAFAGDTATFRFEALDITGNPTFVTEDGADSVALIANGDIDYHGVETEGGTIITLESFSEGPSALDFSGLKNVMLVADDGAVYLDSGNGTIQGPSGFLLVASRQEETGILIGDGINMTGPDSQLYLLSAGDVLLQNGYNLISTPSLTIFAGDTFQLAGMIDTERLEYLNIKANNVNFNYGYGLDVSPDADATLTVTDSGITFYDESGEDYLSLTGFDLIDVNGDIYIESGQLSTDNLVVNGDVYVGGSLEQATLNGPSEGDPFIWDVFGDIYADSIYAPDASVIAYGRWYVNPSGEGGYYGPGYITGDNGITAFDLEADGIYAYGQEGSIYATGNITARGGGEEGGIGATGDITSQYGTINSYNGDIYSTLGAITAGNNILADYGIHAGGGAITAGNNIVNFNYGGITAYGDITATDGHIRNDDGSITATGGNITAGTNIRADYGDITAQANLNTGEGGNITAGNTIDAQNIYADGDITAENGNITARTTNEEYDPGYYAINAYSNEPYYTGTITVGGENLSAVNGTIRADRIVSLQGAGGALNIVSNQLRVGDLIGNGGTFYINSRDVTFTPTQDLPSSGVEFGPNLQNLSLRGAYTLTASSNLGSAADRVQNIDVKNNGGLIQSDGNYRSIFANTITGKGALNFESIDTESLSIAETTASVLKVGSGGISRQEEGPRVMTVNMVSNMPVLTSTGGIQANHTNSDLSAGTVKINSSGDVNFSTTGINGANLNGAYDEVSGEAGSAGVLRTEADGQVLVDNTTLQANTAGASASADGGVIELTSHQSYGVGVRITSTAQIKTLMAAGALGKGGRIIINTEAAGIEIDGTLDAGHTDNIEHGSLVNITQQNGDRYSPIEILGNANINADIIRVRALGPDGTVNIYAGSRLTASDQIKLLAGMMTGSINFMGDGVINITAPQIDMKAHSVNIPSELTTVINNGNTTARTSSFNANAPNQPNIPGRGTFTGPVNVITP